MTFKKHLCLISLTTIFGLGIWSFSYGQTIILRQNHENGIYKSGDKIRVTLYLSDKSTTSVSLKVQKNFSKQTENQLPYSGDTLVVFNEVLNEPTTLVFTAKAPHDSGTIGLIVDPEKYKPATERPKDFEAFWDAQKKALRALPLDVKSVPVTKNVPDGYKCFDVEINSLGSRPARGYFAKPDDAKPKSLPIVIFFHAAGINASWCISKPETAVGYAKRGKGALGFDINAHGILNGQPQSYYDSVNKALNDYPLIGIESKSDAYFLGMYFRLLRAIDFLTSQPEWDGKRILVIGESQGGGQSLAAAGLDERVTAAVVTVPAMCDWGGTLIGRKGSWPYPLSSGNVAKHDKAKLLETLPYFDIAHVLKGSKTTIVAEVGLIDQTCPSSAVFAALNQAEGKKIILTPPYRAHHLEQTAAYKDIWNKTVNKVKEDFIKDYLK